MLSSNLLSFCLTEVLKALCVKFHKFKGATCNLLEKRAMISLILHLISQLHSINSSYQQ